MKELIKRIIFSLLSAIIVVTFLLLVASLSIKENNTYKYLTYENQCGISNNCYFQENQVLVCETENSLVKVRQYYDS